MTGSVLLEGINLLLEAIVNLSARFGILPPVLVRETPEVPKIMLDIATVLSCLPKLDGKTPLLKTPYALVTGHSKTKLEESWKLPSH